MAEQDEILNHCIEFWESELFHSRWLMPPSVQLQIETTIKYLKKLQELEKATPEKSSEKSFP